MKTWIKRTLIGLAAAGTLFGGLAAWAHNHHGYGHGWRTLSAEDAAQMKTRLVDKVGSKLDLDAAQKAKLGVLADIVPSPRRQKTLRSDTATKGQPAPNRQPWRHVQPRP